MTVNDYLNYVAALKDVSPDITKKRINGLLSVLTLEDVKNKKIVKLSGGMKRRVGIAQAMLNEPLVLILDEPTAGLDSGERIRFRNFLAVTLSIPGRTEGRGIQNPNNGVTAVTNAAPCENYGERLARYLLHGSRASENVRRSLPCRGKNHHQSHSDKRRSSCGKWGCSISWFNMEALTFLVYRSFAVSAERPSSSIS